MNYRIYSVHGTFAADASQRGNRWWQKESPFSDAVLSYLDTNTHRITWEPFRWSGDNKTSERGKAADALAGVLSQIDHRKNRVVLVAHSHGGNVAYSARNFAKRKSKIPEAPIVTVGTPFIPESHSRPWLLEKLPELGWVFAFFLVMCIVGLWFTAAGTFTSRILVYSAVAAGILCVFSLYFKIILMVTSRSSWGRGWLLFFRKFIQNIDAESRKDNLADPKIYSLNDEAINALRAAPSHKANLASTEIALSPTAIIIAVVLFFTGVLALQRFGIPFHGDVIKDFTAIFGGSAPEYLSWLNYCSILVVLLAVSTVLGMGISRMFLGSWTAKIFNRLFARVVKERAYGRDTGMSRALPMMASTNLPLVFAKYRLDEEWRPIPKSLDDELDAITADAAIGTFRAIRNTLGLGLTTGSYNFSETISTNFRGDELVHSAYFEHPDFPGFIAWILCEVYDFPKGSEFSKLPINKFQKWWDDIRPVQWINPTEKGTATKAQATVQSTTN